MYTQLICFLIVIFVFTTTPTDIHLLFEAKSVAGILIIQYVLFYFLCRLFYKRATRRIHNQPASSIKIAQATESILNIIAITCIVFLAYGLRIHLIIAHIPWFTSSVTIMALEGLIFYFGYLVIIWVTGHKLHVHAGMANQSTWHYVRGYIVLYVGLLAPWFCISAISELVENYFLSSNCTNGLCQFTLLGIVICTFAILAPPLVVKAWRCKSIPRDTRRAMLEKFCRDHDFRVRDYLFWPLMGGQALTAAVVGFVPRWRYILITPSFYNLLSDEELKAVVAHEMGHIKLRHMPFYLIFFLGFSGLMYVLGDLGLTVLLRSSLFIRLALSENPIDQGFFIMFCSVPVLFFLIVYFRYIFGYFLRNSERQADVFALKVIGNPWSLIRSFQKIAVASGNIEDVPSWHHFSIRERINFLMVASQEPSAIDSHNRKMARSILAFFIIVGSCISIGQGIKHTDWYRNRDIDVAIKIMAEEVGANSPELYAIYGGYLIEKERYREAEAIMKRGLELYPTHPDLCNNLAWLYATAPPPFHLPEEAVSYALRAIEVDSSKAYIWDTLAEAYFASGMYKKALEAIERAIELNPSERYYLKQREKILRHLSTQPLQHR